MAASTPGSGAPIDSYIRLVMGIVTQLSIFLENRPGRLCALTDTISHAGINIQAIMVPSGTDYGIVHLVVDQDERALQLLGEHEYRTYTSRVLEVPLRDHPGALAELTRRLADSEIDIKYGYSASAGRKARMVLAVSDVERAASIISG